MLVATASPSVAERIELLPYAFLNKHIKFLVLAVIVMISLSFIYNEKWIWRLSLIGFSAALLLTFLTLFSHVEIKGATRWISIAGYSIQPSEFIKPSFLVISAWLLAKAKEKTTKEARLYHALVLGNLALCCLLLLSQPDLGMTVLLLISFTAQLFLYGLSLRYFAVLGVLGIIGLGLAYIFFDHVHDRINDFLFPESGDTYQIDRSMESFANGGLFGTGPGQGTVKTQLPDAHADFIFSVAGEEFGFVPTFLLIALYAFIIARALRSAMKSDSLFAMLACGPLLAMVAVQSMIHMGSAMMLIPAKGMTLPFVSYGGSSLIAIGYTFGIILALTRSQKYKSPQI